MKRGRRWASAGSFRSPHRCDPTLRKQINSGEVKLIGMHLSLLPQVVRHGFPGPIHWAVVGAADVTPGAGIV
ncbi:MAG: acetyl-CoA hydrolase, partial [Bryobacteraceae bacterium]|nr:acetyl-CoA hydrolase [Bryobacteraceae bacterium]